MKKILVTGFEPFDGESINPSLKILDALHDVYENARLFKLVVPTVFDESIEVVINEIKHIKPDFVLMLGQASGRKEISIERVALNIDDASMPDNRNIKPIDRMIRKDGKPAYFSTLPIKKLLAVLQNNDYPVSISNSAGTYVCNHLMYGVLYTIDQLSYDTRAGFIHVPLIHEQIKSQSQFSMDLHELIQSIELVINVLTEESK